MNDSEKRKFHRHLIIEGGIDINTEISIFISVLNNIFNSTHWSISLTGGIIKILSFVIVLIGEFYSLFLHLSQWMNDSKRRKFHRHLIIESGIDTNTDISIFISILKYIFNSTHCSISLTGVIIKIVTFKLVLVGELYSLFLHLSRWMNDSEKRKFHRYLIIESGIDLITEISIFISILNYIFNSNHWIISLTGGIIKILSFVLVLNGEFNSLGTNIRMRHLTY